MAKTDALQAEFEFVGETLYWDHRTRKWSPEIPPGFPGAKLTITEISHKDGSITLEATDDEDPS